MFSFRKLISYIIIWPQSRYVSPTMIAETLNVIDFELMGMYHLGADLIRIFALAPIWKFLRKYHYE